MRRLNTCYAQHFNNRHEHVGHVFQNRYFSKPIETDAYLLSAARYIMQNPVKEGMASLLEYPWSSIGEYIGRPARCDTSVLLGMFASIDAFVEFMSENAGDYS